MTENVTFDDFNKNLKRLCDQFQVGTSNFLRVDMKERAEDL